MFGASQRVLFDGKPVLIEFGEGGERFVEFSKQCHVGVFDCVIGVFERVFYVLDCGICGFR